MASWKCVLAWTEPGLHRGKDDGAGWSYETYVKRLERNLSVARVMPCARRGTVFVFFPWVLFVPNPKTEFEDRTMLDLMSDLRELANHVANNVTEL